MSGDRGHVLHTPVCAESAVRFLMTGGAGLYIDGTVGTGGHAERILEAGGPGVSLLGIDRDPRALSVAARRLGRFAQRVRLVEGNFSDLERHAGGTSCAGLLLDLGISSLQIADRRRGFSYLEDGPLEMAMGRDGGSVADLLGRAERDKIAAVLREFGEERRSRRIAAEIVTERARGRIERTARLRAAVERSVPAADRTATLARVFQALRIWANRELEALRACLPQAVRLCAPGARIVVISYHSLEDRIVKQFFRREEKGCACPSDFPRCACGAQPTLRVLTRRPVRPSADETASNPRSRSARLRAAERM